MDYFLQEMVEATNDGLTDKQLEGLEDAHRLYHQRHSGPLAWPLQVGLVTLAKHLPDVKPDVKKTTIKKASSRSVE